MKYIVQSWETWETIDTLASRFGVTYEQITQANPALHSIPIYPGMSLEIPEHKSTNLPTEGYMEYMIQPDDSLYGIAHRFKLNYQKVVDQNPQIDNPHMLWPGQIIYLIYNES